MSALYVRNKFNTWAGEVAAATGTPFYPTINEEQDPLDAVWFSLEYAAEFYSNGTFCKSEETEDGFVRVVVFASPGTTDIPAVTALEAIGQAFAAKTDPQVTIEGFEPLQEMTAGSSDRNYRVGVIVNYTYMTP